MFGTSFSFTNAHFAAGQKAVRARNKNFHDIDVSMPKKLSRVSTRATIARYSSNDTAHGEAGAKRTSFAIVTNTDSGAESPGKKNIIRRLSRWYNDFDANALTDIDQTSSPATKLRRFSLSSADNQGNSYDDLSALPSSAALPVGLDQCADRAIFMGDLNYRIDCDK